MIYVAGIGSRETPQEILDFSVKLFYFLAKLGITTRSGGADGEDNACEKGCDKAKGKKEIFTPWKGFNGSKSNLVVTNPKAFEIAAKFHPAWNRLSDGAKKLQARNVHQVLGWDLETHTNAIICWTKNGKGQGGTGQAIRIAKAYGIPVFDMGSYSDFDLMKSESKKFLISHKILKEELTV